MASDMRMSLPRRDNTWRAEANGGGEGQPVHEPPQDGGKLIVLTATLTETIDHAGYFIQMALASLPVWMEFVLNNKYPKWRNVEYNPDGSARYMPAGLRIVQESLRRQWADQDLVACYPQDLDRFIGPNTRVVAVSTHNPLGVTFAAGVYTSMFGSSKEPINSRYAKQMFAQIKASPYRKNFKVIVGGSGGWQIIQTNAYDELGVDCVVEGRSESPESMALFRQAMAGLYSQIVSTPGVEQHVLSHSTIAPFVVDPLLIKKLSETLLPKSPLHFSRLSTHPEKKVLSPLIGLETGSVRMAKKIMPSKGVPFSIEDWPSVVLG